MIKSVIFATLRILFAAVMALAIVPVANYLVGTAVPDVETNPPASAASASRMLGSLSVQYDIPVPALRFIESRNPGITSAPENGASGSIIKLGAPLQRPIFTERPDLLQAIVAHEFGHAVMHARNETFPLIAIIAMYGCSLFVLLLVFPSKRGMLLGASLATTILMVMSATPRWEVVHNAYRDMLLTLPFLVVFFWLSEIQPTRFLPQQLRAHLPSRRNFALAALLAAPTFLTAAWAVGGMNAEREMRADVIGACATSAVSMKEALRNISDKPQNAMDEALDHFHPPMKIRHEVLDALRSEDLYKQACQAVVAGKQRLDIAGHRIQ